MWLCAAEKANRSATLLSAGKPDSKVNRIRSGEINVSREENILFSNTWNVRHKLIKTVILNIRHLHIR